METTKNAIIEAIDYRLQTIAREANQNASHHIPGTSQLTVRVNNDLKARLDVVADFLFTTRNSLINEFLEVAVEQAYLRILENPYVTGLMVDGKDIKQAMVDALKGAAKASQMNDLINDLESGKITVGDVMKNAQKEAKK